MSEFLFEARDGTGSRRSGAISAADAREAVENLRQRGLYVIRLEPDRSLGGLLRALNRRREARRRASYRDLAVFFRQFVTLFAAGVPVRDAIAILASQSSDKVLAQALRSIADDLRAGVGLSDAFANRGSIFPTVVSSLLRAGEASGALDEIGERLAAHFEREDAVGRKLRVAIAYPATVLVVAFGVVTFLLVAVVPRFADFFAQFNAPLPWPTRLVLSASGLVRRWFWLLAVLTIAVALAFARWRRSERGRVAWDGQQLNLPYFGPLLRKRIIGRVARTLATLLAGGLPVLEALRIAAQVAGNQAVAAAIARCESALRSGGTLHGQLRGEPVFPPLVSELVAAGEETGALDAMLVKVADYFDSEVETTVTRMTALLEPALIVVVGAIVGIVIVSVVWPMFAILRYVQ